MAIQNSINLTATGIVTADGNGVYTGSAVTQFGTVIAGAANAVTSVAPSATVGVPLISAGAASNPGYGTALVAGGGTGSTSFTAGSVVFSDGSVLTQDNSNLFWDDSNNMLGIGTTTPIHTLEVQGHVGLITAADGDDQHALEIGANAAGNADYKAIDINYVTGALAAGEAEAVILVNIDETGALGGEIFGIEILSTTEGTDTVGALKTGVGVDAIHQETGTFGDIDNILNIAVDVTAALADGGAGNISIFVADNDTITLGDAGQWGELEVILGTGASGGGVAPTFGFSTGGVGFSAFVPVDGTNGFKNTGIINWDPADLSGWVTNATGRFEILITRTRNTLTTTPIVDEIQLSATTEHTWNSAGDLSVNSMALATALTVANGGTGLVTITDGGVMVGSGTGAVTPLGVATDGQLIIGSSAADPVLASLIAPAAGITITGGAGTVTFALADGLAALEALAGTGIVVHTAADTYTERSIAVTASTGLSVADGDGVGANPTLAGIDASDSVKGVATFDENDFLVTSADVTFAARTRQKYHGYTENLGINYAVGTGVFSVTSADGTALAVTNPGYVVLVSQTTPGILVTYEIVANQSFIDSNGTSEIVDNLFNLTTGDDWDQDLPFYLYAVANDDEDAISFMCSRVPNRELSPVAAEIGDPSAANADEQWGMFSFEDITEAEWDDNPCACIGGFRMQFIQPGGADDWTVQTLSALDGIGKFYEGTRFGFPTGLMGAASGTYILDFGGTAPVFTTNTFNYFVEKSGRVHIYVNLDGDGGTDGAGAVAFIMRFPFQIAAGEQSCFTSGWSLTNAAGEVKMGWIQPNTSGSVTIYYQSSLTARSGFLNSQFSAGGRQIRGAFSYHISTV